MSEAWLALCLGLALLTGCAPDRSAGGTTGTEAGNAIAARFSLPASGGHDSLIPAAGAVVIARPSDAIDARDAASWHLDTTDDSGRIALRLPEGLWTLEVRLRGFGALLSLPDLEHTTVRHTLVPLRTLRGVLVGAEEGSRVSLPGAGVTVAVGAGGAFALDSVPAQSLELRVAGQTVALSSDTGSVLLGGGYPLEVFRAPVAVQARGRGLPFFVGESLLPAGQIPVLLDSLGRVLPHRRGGTGSRGARLWTAPTAGAVPAWIAIRDAPVAASALFDSVDGYRLAWIPDLSPQDLSPTRARFLVSGTPQTDSVEGPNVVASLGSTLGEIDSGLPETGAFGLVLRGRATSVGIEDLWLLDWTDARAMGVRIGMGGGLLTARVGDRDTAVVWNPGTSWFGMAVSWDGRMLRLAIDGDERLALVPTTGVLDQRASWSRRQIGLGGGLALSAMLVLDRAVEVQRASRSGVLIPR